MRTKNPLRGADLRRLRIEAKLTIPKAADLLGVGFETYRAWEYNANGVSNLAFETIEKKMKDKANEFSRG